MNLRDATLTVTPWGWLLLVALVPVWHDPGSAWGQSGEAASMEETDDESRVHRVDVTTLFFDDINTESLTLVLGYTRNLSENANLSLSLPYLDEDLENAGSGKRLSPAAVSNAVIETR